MQANTSDGLTTLCGC